MNSTLIVLQDSIYGFEFEFMADSLFVNISKLCRDHHKDLDEWKKEHYEPLFLALERFAQHHHLKHYQSLIYENDFFIDPSIAFHLAYWIDYTVGISYCSMLFKMIYLIRS